MRAGVTASVLSLALFGCTGAGEPMEAFPERDASGFEVADAAVADAAAEADAAGPDAAPIPATVNTPDSCLFLLQGPGAEYPKVQCAEDTGAFCTGANEICMPDRSAVLVTGAEVEDPEQEICTHWYPVTFRSYEGFCCGDYLILP